MRRRLALISATSLLLVGLAACGSDSETPSEDPSTAPAASAIDGVTVKGDFNAKPDVTVKDLKVTDPETDVLIEGDGPKAEAGAQALINLHLVNGTTGKQAYSTYDAERPTEVTLSPDQLPGGLDEAIVGQTRGSRVVFAATVKEAIGPDGADQIGLGPDDDVVFVVDLVSLAPSDVLEGPEGTEQSLADDLPEVETDGDAVTGFDFSSAPKKPSKKLQVITLVEGDGPAIPDDARYVTFNYFGEVYGAKKPFDESYSRGPATFPVGNGGLISAWDEGLKGVKAGSRVMLVVPPEQGYGEQGSPPSIPANATLVFVIDVLGVDV